MSKHSKKSKKDKIEKKEKLVLDFSEDINEG